MRTFLRIVEAGSLSAAAVQLGTTQPTISRRLRQLERMLGLRLLRRSTHRMALTEDGERCLAHARDLLDGWGAMEAELRGARDAPRGLLRVQAPHAFGQDQLIAPLAEYLRAHPAVAVEWQLHDRMPDFIADGVDCAIRVGRVDDPSVVAVRLADVPRIVVSAPGLWGAGPPPAEAAALPALPWLALNTFYRDEVTLSHAARGEALRFPIRPRLSTDSLHALRAATLAGLGAAIVSAWVVAEDLRQGRLAQLAPAWRAAPLPVFLVYPAGRLQPAKLRHFISLMRARMPGIAGLEPTGRNL
ncbi:LysR family transcriptional regulator [Roseomonas sp. GC11]|uniref:LysR family transcriptional regulator n=1 Tax=Roseomonas sp. GC11 TaxID=2950546 RepID=UPI00210C6914|nr:LysR family transcriptional regulator [Roseomonas sp. GC11]